MSKNECDCCKIARLEKDVERLEKELAEARSTITHVPYPVYPAPWWEPTPPWVVTCDPLGLGETGTMTTSLDFARDLL